MESKDSFRNYETTSRRPTFTLQRVLQGEEGEKEAESLFEKIMAEDFHNMGKETNIQIQESQRVLNKINRKRATPRNIVVKMTKVKTRIES